MIKVGEAKERTYFLDFSGCRPGSNAIQLDWVHGKLTRFHDHPEIFDLWYIELTFFELQMEVKLGHPLEDVAGSFGMGCGVRGGNEEVIHIDNQPSFSDHVSERVIHESLECGGGVAKTKEHNGQFKESFVGDKGCFPLVTIFDTDVVISLVNIEFGEVVSVFQLVHEVRDEREGVGVMGSVFVEVAVVLAGAEFSVFLLDKEERGCLGGVGRTNLSSG